MPEQYEMFWEVYALDRQEYLTSLTDQIRAKRARAMVAKEVEAHIEDQKQDFIAHGFGEVEAEAMAVAEMGDPVETGVKLDRIHRPKMEWTVLTVIIVISIMGLILQAVITSSFPTMNMSTMEALKDNFLYGGLWSAMLIGIAVMLVICYMDYSILVKWAFPIWIILQIPAVLSIFTNIFFDETIWIGPIVNGRSMFQMILSYLVIPFYAGTIYHFRGKGKKGLIISTVCLGISVLTNLMIPFMSSALVTGITGLILLHVAICKGWFGENKKKFLVKMWGVIGICLILMLGVTFLSNGHFITDYQAHRLEALFTGEHWDYTRSAVADVANAAKNPDSSEWIEAQSSGNIKVTDPYNESTEVGAITLYNYARNDYIWTYLFHYFGTAKGIFLVIVFAAFLGLLLRMAVKQKNRLGYMISIGCVLYLALQSLFYIGVNAGLCPIGGNYMPFLSHGNMTMMITYFYMGILLSVYRNTNIVKN